MGRIKIGFSKFGGWGGCIFQWKRKEKKKCELVESNEEKRKKKRSNNNKGKWVEKSLK